MRVVWIEIIAQGSFVTSYAVTTLRVVWIEIGRVRQTAAGSGSPPCGWCGLKFENVSKLGVPIPVTTLRVVWIEIIM